MSRISQRCFVGPLVAVVVGCVVGVDVAGACTSIVVGAQASVDGSVMTSHTCDSHRTESSIRVVPARGHSPGAEVTLYRRTEDDSAAMPRYGKEETGAIPQVDETHGYLDPAYAALNDRQVAIGESTFGGREELVSDAGLIDCQRLTALMLERAGSAREAVEVAGELVDTYGWVDEGEALTVTDPEEAWVLEIVGPGQGRVGAVWAAQRVPDDHVFVTANSSRIGEIDLDRPSEFIASSNVVDLAVKRGYWDPEGDRPFRFYEAYNPEGNYSFSSSRRVWRVFDLLAPSLELNANANVFPFSVKPEEPVSAERIMEIFRDTYEGTPYDLVKNLVVPDEDGRMVKSPLANPFMPYDMYPLFKINGGWGELGERQIARWYAMYVTVIQSRSWLPDEVGGLLWFGYSNPAMTLYVPLYAGITDLPDSYETDGRITGFSRDSAWWAFNRVATLAAHRWGDMRTDVAAVRDPLQAELLEMQGRVAAEAVRRLGEDRASGRAYLTRISAAACERATAAYWDLGDHLWTAYDEQW